MTKRLLSTALLFSLAAPYAAFAHPGHHDHMAPTDLAMHVWSSPFHAFFLVLGLFALAGVLFTMRKGIASSLRKIGVPSKTKSKGR